MSADRDRRQWIPGVLCGAATSIALALAGVPLLSVRWFAAAIVLWTATTFALTIARDQGPWSS